MIAPFFSQRAKRRRAALRQLKREMRGAYVGFVLRFPLDDIAESEYRDPLLLSATNLELRIQTLDRSRIELAVPWKGISPIIVEYAPATELMPVLVFTTTVGTEQTDHRFLGGHSSGTFVLSIQLLQRMARTIERQRPHSPIGVGVPPEGQTTR